jgi:hypothetical protein
MSFAREGDAYPTHAAHLDGRVLDVDGLARRLSRAGLASDAELKFTSQGTALVSVSVSVQDSKAEGQPQWIRIGKFSDDDAEAEELVRQLVRGSEVYCEVA